MLIEDAKEAIFITNAATATLSDLVIRRTRYGIEANASHVRVERFRVTSTGSTTLLACFGLNPDSPALTLYVPGCN